MSYTFGQKLWMVGVFAFFCLIMADVLNFIDVPPIYMLAALSPLILTWGVMPSIKELSKQGGGRVRQGERR